MKKYIKYAHYGEIVTVREDLKGKHREHCLCWICEKFNPKDRDSNCPIANELFEFDKKNSVTTPVWECKKFRLLAG